MKHPDFEKNYGKDTVSLWGILGPPIKIVLIIYASFWLMAFFPSINEWLDRNFDSSDQMRTGIVLLALFSMSAIVLLFPKLLARISFVSFFKRRLK